MREQNYKVSQPLAQVVAASACQVYEIVFVFLRRVDDTTQDRMCLCAKYTAVATVGLANDDNRAQFPLGGIVRRIYRLHVQKR